MPLRCSARRREQLPRRSSCCGVASSASREIYLDDYDVDVREIESSGAAGGLAGGLAAIGAQLVSGFELVANETDLADAIEGADLVVTGEGFVDAQSFEGKVVGGVVDLAAALEVPALVVAGEVLRRV